MPYHRTASLSHLHGAGRTQGLKLQHRGLQISLHSPHMPDGGEERITGFTASGPARSLCARACMARPDRRTLAAHKGAGEESSAGRRTKTKRGRVRSGAMLDGAEGGRTEAGKCGQRNDSAHEWECEDENKSKGKFGRRTKHKTSCEIR